MMKGRKERMKKGSRWREGEKAEEKGRERESGRSWRMINVN